MRKLTTILLIALIFFAFGTVKGQTIQSSNYGTNGYIKSDGTIQNSSYSTVGYIKPNGTIQNSSIPRLDTSKAMGQYKIAAIQLLAM